MTAEKVRGPRNYIEHFGTAEACAKVAVSAPPLEMSRAWAQHRLVVALHADLRRIGLTVEDFIRTLGRNVRTLGEKMSGLSWVTLDDLVEITLFLGPTCVQEWGRLVEQTFPANYWPEPPGWRPGHLTLPSGGTAVRGAHWPSIAQEAQMLALTMRRSGTGHLIDDAQLGRLTREVLVGREVAASELQLRSEAGANVFDVGDDVSVAAVWGRDPVSSAARDELRRRVAVSVAGLVASKRDELVIIAVVEPLSREIVLGLLGSGPGAPAASVDWVALARHLPIGTLPLHVDVGVSWHAEVPGGDGFSALVGTVHKGP